MGGPTNSTEQFNIRWKNYSSVLQNFFREHLEEERLVDVTLGCEGGFVKCHRIILSACSSYFENVLNELSSQGHVVIFMKDLKLWELQALIDFMYKGEVSVPQNRLAPLVRAAESLHIRGLSSEGDGTNNIPGNEEDDEEYYLPQQPKSSSSTSRNNSSGIRKSEGTKINESRKRPSLSGNGPPRLIKMPRGQDESRPSPRGPPPSRFVRRSNSSEGKEQDAIVKNEEDFCDYQQDDGEGVEQMEGEIEEGEQLTSGELRNGNHPYNQEVRDSALAALNSGHTLAQCAEAFGVSKKTLSRWRQAAYNAAANSLSSSFNASPSNPPPIVPISMLEDDNAGEDLNAYVDHYQGVGGVQILDPPMTEPVTDATDRANRLQKATDLALSGVTVRQAASHYGIPRTTLCAYMKRKGLAGKRTQAAANNPMARNAASLSEQHQSEDDAGFHFLGLSEFVEAVQDENGDEGDGRGDEDGDNSDGDLAQTESN